MNIAIFTDSYFPDVNGVSVSAKTLVDTLKNNGHNVIVVTAVYGSKDIKIEGGVYYVPFRKRKRRSFFTTLAIYRAFIYKHVRNFKPDIIHDQTNGHIGQLGRFTADRLRIPFVYTYHAHFEEYATYVDSDFINRLARARERRYLKKMMNISTEFIAPSIKIKNYLRKKGVDRYINVITTGIDVKEFEANESVLKDVKYLRKKYELENDEKVLFYVGALSKEKNIDLLIKSYKFFLDTNSKYQVRLIIAGEGEEDESLKKMVDELGLNNKVIFAGKINHEKIKSYLALADVFVTASTSETQSISTMEAMAASCVVLVKEEETLANLLINGENGFIFTDEESFSDELEKVLSLSKDNLAKVKKVALKAIADNFSLDDYYQKIMEVYDRAKRKKW